MRTKFIDIAVFLYILLFVYAATTKLQDYQKFVIQLGQSPILTQYSTYLAWGIPFLELLIAVLLIIPYTRLLAMYAAFSLMVMFTTYIVLASRFSDYVPCSCGGVLEGMSWTHHLIFNVVFVLLGCTALMAHPRMQVKSNAIARS